MAWNSFISEVLSFLLDLVIGGLAGYFVYQLAREKERRAAEEGSSTTGRRAEAESLPGAVRQDDRTAGWQGPESEDGEVRTFEPWDLTHPIILSVLILLVLLARVLLDLDLTLALFIVLTLFFVGVGLAWYRGRV
jgi:hypothetical protein